MLRFLRKRRSRAVPEASFEPPGAPGPIYAIGDIHGRYDLLERLAEMIAVDSASFEERATWVFLGDYIDRGEHDCQVVELLMNLAKWPEADMVFLMGNHEQMLLQFLREPDSAGRWLRFGGRETLLSYGIGGDLLTPGAALELRAELSDALGPHLGFIEGLRLCHRAGNIFFAHAGADPVVPVDEQDVQVLLWGCPAFRRAPRTDGIWVAHGHFIVDHPGAEAGRIAVDTGAYYSGRLTAARIHRGAVAFLQT